MALAQQWSSSAALPVVGLLQKQLGVLHYLYVAFALFSIPVMGRGL